jgi:two-component system, OmpR family, sensor kinase
MSLRLRLLVALVGIVLVGLIVSDVVTYSSLRSFLIQRVDQQLAAAQGAVGHCMGSGPGNLPDGPDNGDIPPGTVGEVLDSTGAVVAHKACNTGATSVALPDLPSRLGTRASDIHVFTTGAIGNGSLRYRVFSQGLGTELGAFRGTFVVAIPLTDVSQTLGRLQLVELFVTLGVLVGLGFLSLWIVRRGLRPLEKIGETAGAIAEGDLSRRIESTDPKTEVGRLGIALNAMLTQIEGAFAERKASEDRLRRFVADASHELRTPLTSIRGYAELFRRGAKGNPSDLEKSMQRIEAEASRMGVLVDDLLLLARLDQGRPLDRAPVDLVAIAADAAADARMIDPGRQVELDAPDSAVVEGDEYRLRQVAANLLGNALQHTAAGSPVHIRVGSGDAEAWLEVADAGPGIPPEEAKLVFEPFYRSDPSRGRSSGGVGLGLAIVAAIVEAHGGRVGVDTASGQGTTFRVVLPRAGRAEAAGAPNGERVVESPGGGAEGQPAAEARER